jgi:hypothetical protein
MSFIEYIQEFIGAILFLERLGFLTQRNVIKELLSKVGN